MHTWLETPFGAFLCVPLSADYQAMLPSLHSQSRRTSADALLDVQDCILSTDAGDYIHWRKENPQEPGKSVGDLVGHIQNAFRQRFESSGEHPAISSEPRVPFAVLLGWLAEKLRSHGADIEEGKELLWELAGDEHQLYRVRAIVAKANRCDDATLNHEGVVDKAALNKMVPMVEQATEASKKALREWAALAELEPFEWQARGFEHGHRKKYVRSEPVVVRFTESTPLFNAFMMQIASHAGDDFLEHINESCFAGDLCFPTPTGDRLEKAAPLHVKLEDLFRICLTRRSDMAEANGWSDADMHTRVATSDEMREMMNSWRHDVESYMAPGTLERYNNLPRQAAHQLGKSVFSAHLFQISGCKFLVSELIQSPVLAGCVSSDSRAAQPAGSRAAQPARTMSQFLEAYRQHKQTEFLLEL